MLLTLHNLPHDMRYSDIKSLLREKCGLTEVILDNLLPVGNTKKVTIGVSEEADAAIIVRKINGLHIKGQQLYVEDVRKKRKANEQPFRSSDTSYHNEMVKEMIPEQPVATPYMDPQTAYQMNYAMMAGMYGYMPQVQDPNYGYTAQNMPVMPLMPALTPAGNPANDQVNNWQNRQLQQNQGDSWQNPQSHEDYRQECGPSGDSWQNPPGGDNWQNPQAHDGFRQDWQGRDDSRQNQSAHESYRQPFKSREDPWQNPVKVSASTQGRASRWESDQTASLAPPVNEARPYFEHAHPETSGRDMHSRNDRRHSSGNRWSSNDGQAFNEDHRGRSPHGRGFQRQVAAEPVMYARSQERDDSLSRPPRDKRAFEPPQQRPPRPEKRARYEEPSEAPTQDRLRHHEPTFPAPTEDRSHWDGQRHANERRERRPQSHGQGFNEPRPGFERPAPEYCPEKAMRREETFRQQAAAKIANMIIERSPIEVSGHLLYKKILKTTIRIRLDRLLGHKSGILPTEMVMLYSDKFPRASDRHTNTSVLKRFEQQLELDLGQPDSGVPTGVAPQVPPKAPMQPRKTPTTVAKFVPGPAKQVTVPKGGLPKFPNGDKAVFQKQRQMRKLESQHDDVEELYPLPPLTTAALDSELEAITDVIKQECADPPEEDEIICEKILTETVQDMKKRANRENVESHIESDTSTETVIIGLASPETSHIANRIDISNCDNYVEEDNIQTRIDIKYKVKEEVEKSIIDLICDSNEGVESNHNQTEMKCEVNETHDFDADCEDESDECPTQVIENLDNFLVVNVEQEEVDQLLEINEEEEEAYKDKILAFKNKNKFVVVDKQKSDDAITNIIQDVNWCPQNRKKDHRKNKEIIQENIINSEHSIVTDEVRKEGSRKSLDASDDSDADMQEKFYDSITNISHNQNDKPSELEKDSIERAPNIVIQIPSSSKVGRICKLIDDKTEEAESSAIANKDNTHNSYPHNNTGRRHIENEIKRRRPSSRCKRKRLINSTLKDDKTDRADSAYASKYNTQFDINVNSNIENDITNNASCSKKDLVENVAECYTGRQSRCSRWRRNLSRKLADNHVGPTESYSKINKENTQRIITENTDKSKEMLRIHEESDARSHLTRIRNEKNEIPNKNANNGRKCCYREEDINDLLAKIRYEEESSKTEREVVRK